MGPCDPSVNLLGALSAELYCSSRKPGGPAVRPRNTPPPPWGTSLVASPFASRFRTPCGTSPPNLLACLLGPGSHYPARSSHGGRSRQGCMSPREASATVPVSFKTRVGREGWAHSICNKFEHFLERYIEPIARQPVSGRAGPQGNLEHSLPPGSSAPRRQAWVCVFRRFLEEALSLTTAIIFTSKSTIFPTTPAVSPTYDVVSCRVGSQVSLSPCSLPARSTSGTSLSTPRLEWNTRQRAGAWTPRPSAPFRVAAE